MTAVNNHVPTGLNIAETSQNHVLIKWTGNKSFNYKYELLKYDVDTETYVQFSTPLYVEGGITHYYVPITLGDVTLKVRSVRLTDNVVSLISESSVSINWETVLENNSTDYQKIQRHLITETIHFKMPAVLDAVGAASIIVDEDFEFDAPRNYIVDTSVEAITGLLPSDAGIGFTSHAFDGDADGTWDVNNFTLSTEGDETINGSSDDYVADFKGGHLMIIRKTLTDWFVRFALFFFFFGGLSAEGRFVWEKNNIEMNPNLSISVDKIKARSSGDLLSIADSDGTTIAVFSTSGMQLTTLSVINYYETSAYAEMSIDVGTITTLSSNDSYIVSLASDISAITTLNVVDFTASGVTGLQTASFTELSGNSFIITTGSLTDLNVVSLISTGSTSLQTLTFTGASGDAITATTGTMVDLTVSSLASIASIELTTLSASGATITTLIITDIISDGSYGMTTDVTMDGNVFRFKSGLLTDINPE